jgi:hypothetical protein
MVSFREWFPVNVDFKEQEEAYFRNHDNVSWHMMDPSNPAPLYWDNPYFTLYENFETDNRDRLMGFIGVRYKITEWMSISGRASLDGFKEKQEERIAVGAVQESSYSRFNRTWRENNYEIRLNFDKDFKVIRVNGLLGGNIRQAHEEWIRAATRGGLKTPGVYALYNSVDPMNPPEESDIHRQVNSVFANLLGSYKNRVYVEGSFRRDHFSGVSPLISAENYMSVGAGYLFSGLLGNPAWLEFGKLWMNYGEAGNEFRIGILPPFYEISGSFTGNSLISTTDASYPFPLSLERTRGMEAGIEMYFLNNRIDLNLTRYAQSSINQIISVPVSEATGYDNIYINSGEIQNKGWELFIHGIPLKYSNFSWSIELNWTRNRNKVVHLHSQFPEKMIGSFPGGITTYIIEGEPIGVIKGTDFDYDDNGRRIVGANGMYRFDRISHDNIGQINPDWLAGFSNMVRYKNYSLSVLFDFRRGGDLFNVDMYYGMGTGLYPETAGMNDLGNPIRNSIEQGGGILFDGVQEDGSENNVRVRGDLYGFLGWRGMPAAAFMYDAGYVKLRELIFTWSVPGKLLRKMGPVKNMDISLTGHNLWILHKDVPYADPEDFASAGNYAFGVQAGTYPTVRYFGFNLRADF